MLTDLEKFEDWLKIEVRSQGTRSTYMCVLRQWSSFLNGKHPTKQAAEDFLEYRRSLGKAASSLYSYKVILNRYFEWRGESVALNCPEITQTRSRNLREYYRKNYLKTGGEFTKISGKRTRPEACELCRITGRLSYHHWDSGDFSKGLWLCWRCHAFAEGVDAGLSPESYLSLKQKLEANVNERN